MPDAVTPESQRSVRRVFARGDLCRGADRGGIDTRERQQRADDAVAFGSHAGETREPASARHVEEDGLGLIVTRVTRRDRRRAEIARDTSQERVAGVARIVLVHRRRVRATHTQRGTDVVGELRDERGVGSRRARTRAVIEVRDVKDESELFAQLREDETERGRIGAAGNGEHDRTGAQEFVGAREGANGAKDSGLRAVRQRWLGADSSRRSVGYESTALGQLSYPASSARDAHSTGGIRPRAAFSRARNSGSVSWPFLRLQFPHAGSTLSIEFVPPRDNGVRWSTSSGPSPPQYAHLPSFLSTRACHSALVN